MAVALTVAGSAVAFDCIRVSASLQGPQQSTNSGNWLLFDFSTVQGAQTTFAHSFGADLSAADAACFVKAYGAANQPLYFALGIGVAGGKKTTTTSNGARAGMFGVLAWHNRNVRVLSNGTRIDHLDDSPILGALFGAFDTGGIVPPAAG
ncbi:MAG: hypothetical protein H0X39_19975 [Actinobacteria bacterium]|nr:hypothetical protein [Actinomycetota bacterium]